MPDPSHAARPRRPGWRPLLGGSAALFLVILALLAGRVQAGADPALRDAPARTQTTREPGSSVPAPSSPATDEPAAPSPDPSPPATQAS